MAPLGVMHHGNHRGSGRHAALREAQPLGRFVGLDIFDRSHLAIAEVAVIWRDAG